MANWAGTSSVANATGTLTGADATTATNTGASWPTGGTGLSNFHIRILSGAGASTTPVLISSNTATVLTLGEAWPNGTPDATSTYEIVLRLKNNDHITGNLIFSTNTITEIEDGATVFLDGNYYINSTHESVVFRWEKTENTFAKFCANNRTVVGKMRFWQYFRINATLTTAPRISFIGIWDSDYGIVIDASTNCDYIHHLWIEASAHEIGFNNGALSKNQTLKNIYVFGNYGWLQFGTCTGNYEAIYEKCFCRVTDGHKWTDAGIYRQTIRDSVFCRCTASSGINQTADQKFKYYDNYFNAMTSSSVLMGVSSSAGAGELHLSRNVLMVQRPIYANITGASTKAWSKFNDVRPKAITSSSYSFIDSLSGSFNTLESDNDYISGMAGAIAENVDTTASTTSTANPKQYEYLTATRTNVKSVLNKPLLMDNVVIGTPTHDSVTITFDCANGSVEGQGSTTVDADSAASQAVLKVGDTTGFEVGEIVEIGYGTPRSETARVLSISAGDSLTLETNLVYEHTALQADTVKKQLRLWALPVVIYGINSGSYQESSPLPCCEYYGLIYTGLMTTFRGLPIEFKKTGHSVTLTGLKPNTTYYFVCGGKDPLDNVFDETTEYSFKTAPYKVSSVSFS